VALGCADPALRVADAKARDPRRQERRGDLRRVVGGARRPPVAVADLADAVRDAADPAGRGRQYLAHKVRALEGTRPRASRWFAARAGQVEQDRYALRQTARRATRGRAIPVPPMAPMADGPGAADEDEVVL
jgi:hypothetical protein